MTMANRRNGNRRAAVDGEPTHEILRDGDKTIVRLAGDLDFATVAEVMPVLEEACARNPAQVVLDLSRVEFLDSSGISLLVTVHKRRTADGCSLVVTNPSAAVSRVLEVTATDRVLSITHTSPSSILVRG
jgi:anti-sigma B factor antagonist